eukprot:jgi/Picsp_1/3261/NSC_06101-R1_isopentenyl-diphosphate delta-isomerase i
MFASVSTTRACLTTTDSATGKNMSYQQQPGAQWDGSASQEDFMKKDECILVNDRDEIVGHSSKYQAHRFVEGQPSGLLHRAFSVFLFDNDGKLLLQQRAASKITFPNVWTNTCCSHPLHGYNPTEVDGPEHVQDASVPGAKRAAIRKLNHELGIDTDSLLGVQDFKFLTRLHYCARDDVTWGPESEWGEHEMDYILLCRVSNLTLHPNAEEVQATKYVTLEELEDMMRPENGLIWSPWFRIIAERFLRVWWKDLDRALTTDAHVDTKTIHSI